MCCIYFLLLQNILKIFFYLLLVFIRIEIPYFFKPKTHLILIKSLFLLSTCTIYILIKVWTKFKFIDANRLYLFVFYINLLVLSYPFQTWAIISLLAAYGSVQMMLFWIVFSNLGARGLYDRPPYLINSNSNLKLLLVILT